jgi:lysozyme
MDVKNIGDKGIDLIKSFEGCHLKAYNATGVERYLTIGWGHYGPDVYPGMTITQERADEMFVEDLQRYVAYVNNPDYVTITYELNQNQFDALVSFCYNCGPGSLKEACKGKRTPEEIAVEIIKYNKGGSKVLPGLVRRREAELELFNKEVIIVMQDWAFEFIEAVMGDYWERMNGNAEVQNATHLAMEDLRKATGRKSDE